MTIILFLLLFFGLLAIGMPIFLVLGMCAAVLYIASGEPLVGVTQVVIDHLNSPTLMSLPLFVMAATFMRYGGVAKALVDVSAAWLGGIRGSLGLVTVVACTLFAAISGSSVATALAMGTILLPAMIEKGYPRSFALGVVGASGTIGIVIPPSLALILYGIVAEQSVPRLFLAGVLPGLLQAAAFFAWVWYDARRRKFPVEPSLPWAERWRVTARAIPALIVPAVVLMRIGWKPRFALALSPRVRQNAALMAPGLFGTAIYQINIFVSRMLAFSLAVSTATLLFYANRLMELPIGVFAIAVSTVVYPLIARHAAEGKFAAMADDFRKGLRLILMINVPAAAGLALLGEPIVRLIYQHGAFTAQNTADMVPLLTLFVVGLPFFSVVNLTVRAFYAVKDTATPVKIAFVDFTINLALSLLLMRWLGAIGLVLASTIAIIVQTLLLQRALARKLPGMTFAPLWPSVGKVLAATLAMSVVVEAGWRGLEATGAGRRVDLVAVAGLIPLGAVVYVAALWALRIEGREELNTLWKTFRAKLR